MIESRPSPPGPIEHDFRCPYCWEPISMVLEPTTEEQRYVEDCEVCCHPIEVTVRLDPEGGLSFRAERLGQ